MGLLCLYYLGLALIKTMFAEEELVFIYDDIRNGKYSTKLGQFSLSFVC
jgi:hypothetical protein